MGLTASQRGSISECSLGTSLNKCFLGLRTWRDKKSWKGNCYQTHVHSSWGNTQSLCACSQPPRPQGTFHSLPIPMSVTVLRSLGNDRKASKHCKSCERWGNPTGKWGNPTGKLTLETQLSIQYACPEEQVTELAHWGSLMGGGPSLSF